MGEQDRQILDGTRSPAEFERFMISLLARSGEYHQVVQESPVQGRLLDAAAVRNSGGREQKIVFEVKYRHKDRRVSTSDVQSILTYFRHAVEDTEFADAQLVIVTNTYPTLAARDLCKLHGIRVIDRDEIIGLMRRVDVQGVSSEGTLH